MFGGGKKKEEPKVVKMKADPKQAERLRKAALEKARKAGKEVKETKAGVGRPEKESPRQERERRNREAINRISARGQKEDPQWQGIPPAGRKGSKGGRWD